MYNRRQFLTRATALSVGAVAVGSLASCANGGTASGPPAGAWEDLRKQLKGALALPDDPTFASLAIPRNTAFANTRPAGVALCADMSDVQACVNWARNNGVAPVPRSPNGHSLAGYCATTGLSIDTTRLNAVKLDPATQRVLMGAGTALGPAGSTLAESSRMIPIGRCPTVGIAGLVLAGGFGFDSLVNGLTCDNLVETKVVLANGEVVNASATENPDLFWALRGGNGGTFGINTSFTLQTFAAPQLSVFDIRWDGKEVLHPVWAALQQICASAPPEFSVRFGLTKANPGDTAAPIILRAVGQSYGSLDSLRELLRPATKHEAMKTVLSATDFATGTSVVGVPAGSPGPFQVKSAYMDQGLPDSGIDTLINWMSSFPKSARFADFGLFRWGAAINKVAPTSTAFVHRSGAFLIEADSSWYPGSTPAVVDECKAWQADGFNQLQSYFTGYAFQNFIDRTQPGWQKAYYGQNFDRLVEVKTRVDPNNLFNNQQSIPTGA